MRNQKRNFLVGAMLFALCAVSPAQAAPTIADSGFELDAPPVGSSVAPGNGWTATGNGAVYQYAIYQSQGLSNVQPSDGSNVFIFNPGSSVQNTDLSQVITGTLAGSHYDVSFLYGNINGTGTQGVTVSAFDSVLGLDGSQLFTATQTTATTDLNNVFQEQTFSFTALGATTTLHFVDTTTGTPIDANSDGLLDNIFISLVPELSPTDCLSTLAVTFFGLLMVGDRRRRA